MRCKDILVILLALAETGCVRHETESRTIWESVSYSDAKDQERFEQALTAGGIPYKVVTRERAQEFVEWDAGYSAQVEQIKDSLFLPSGRNIRLDPERQARFKAWLDHHSIPYRTMIEVDGEYVVWEESDAERVRGWDEFPSYYDNPPISPRQ